jgi:hypothetical protein
MWNNCQQTLGNDLTGNSGWGINKKPPGQFRRANTKSLFEKQEVGIKKQEEMRGNQSKTSVGNSPSCFLLLDSDFSNRL